VAVLGLNVAQVEVLSRYFEGRARLMHIENRDVAGEAVPLETQAVIVPRQFVASSLRSALKQRGILMVEYRGGLTQAKDALEGILPQLAAMASSTK
jgi:hypothetical protein